MSRKQWILTQSNKDLASRIAEDYSLDPFSALLLSARGVGPDSGLDDFLDTASNLLDPFLLPDMQKAVDRINEAIFDYERICVFGDYDADGVTSTALLYSYLETQGANVTYLLPHREKDGYGLSKGVIDTMKSLDTQLIITVDNGIAAVDEAQYIKELGMDLIITDHHLPGDVLPEAIAVVDPHREDSPCPFEDYCGVGVAFKLCCALEGNEQPVIDDYIDLVAIGTVADLVPLVGENRKLVQLGLVSINRYPRPGVEAILEVAGLRDKTILSTNIAFGIAPRINAAGRMDTAELALDVLLSESEEDAADLAEKLNQKNAERHEAEDNIFQEAITFLKEHPEQAHQPVIIVCGEQWHEGVLGIVASKLVSRYLKPAIVLTKKDSIAKGSCRSIEGFHIHHALSACKEHLVTFGGHELAAGLTVSLDHFADFFEAMQQYAYLQPSVYPTTKIDCKLNPASISLDLLASIELLEPFGSNNPSPIFGLFNMTIDAISSIGQKDNHKRIQLHREGSNVRVNALKFNTVEFSYQPGDVVDLIVTLNRNEYNGKQSVSIFIQDIRPHNADDSCMREEELLYDRVLSRRGLSAEEANRVLPDRAAFGALYTYLKKHPVIYANDYEYLHFKTFGSTQNLCKTRIALQAMTELGLVSISENHLLELPEATTKVNLQEAPIMTYLQQFIS